MKLSAKTRLGLVLLRAIGISTTLPTDGYKLRAGVKWDTVSLREPLRGIWLFQIFGEKGE